MAKFPANTTRFAFYDVDTDSYTYDMTSGSFYLSDISGNSIIIHAAWGLSYSATFYVITE